MRTAGIIREERKKKRDSRARRIEYVLGASAASPIGGDQGARARGLLGNEGKEITLFCSGARK